MLRIVWFKIGYDFNHAGGTLLANSSVALLLVGIWYLADIVSSRLDNQRIVQEFLPLTGFVYFMHYPVNDFIKYHLHIQNHNLMFVLLCVFAPVFYLVSAWMTRKFLNRIYFVLSGGR